MMRPRPARWFEALVAREDCAMLLEALAATGLIELETQSDRRLVACNNVAISPKTMGVPVPVYRSIVGCCAFS